ncbi:MAG: immune inhibitor A, partial [Verrucomicrobiae bacterium]|nr:immune inhibitor A [Verrucomicrobiae bacterium]
MIAHSGRLSATDSHGAFYLNNTDASLTLASNLSLLGSTRPALGFYHRYSLEDGYDFGRVEISTDGGSTWAPLPGAEFTGGLANFEREQFDLSPYIGVTGFRVRFRLQTDDSVTRDGWYVDDMVVAEAPAPVVLSSPTAVSGTRVDLSWSVSGASDFHAYHVYRSNTPGTPWQEAHLVAEVLDVGVTTFSDMTVAPKSSYHYQILVVAQTGLSSTSNEATTTTPIGVAFPFLDNGEAGGGDWAADPPWELSEELAASATHAWSDSPGSNYAENITSQALTLAFPMNLAASGANRPALSYRHHYALGSGDTVSVEISGNGGSDWTTLANYTGNSSDLWRNGRHDLSAYTNQTAVLVRFRLTTDPSSSADGWHVDDIAVSEQPAMMAAPTVVSVNRQAIELAWTAYTGLDFQRYRVYRDTTASVGINSTLVADIDDPATTTFTDNTVQLDTDYHYRLYVVNGFGTHGPDSPATASGRARSLPLSPGFIEDFESDLGPEWVVKGSWGRTDETAHGGTFSLTDSPGVNYPKNTNTSTSFMVDLTGTAWPVLRFWHQHQFGGGDYGVVEGSADGGASWTQLAGASGDALDWAHAGVDLSQWKGQADYRIRFRVISDGGEETGDGWYIDDVALADHPGGVASLPLVEGFEAGLGDWITDGRLDGVEPREGAAAVRVGSLESGWTTSYLVYGREVELPASGVRYLSFWLKDSSANDEFYGGQVLYLDV